MYGKYTVICTLAAAAAATVVSCDRSRLMARDVEGCWEVTPMELTLAPDTTGAPRYLNVVPSITFVREPDDIGGHFIMETDMGGSPLPRFRAVARGSWTIVDDDCILLAFYPGEVESDGGIHADALAREAVMNMDRINSVSITYDNMTGRIAGKDIVLTRR